MAAGREVAGAAVALARHADGLLSLAGSGDLEAVEELDEETLAAAADGEAGLARAQSRIMQRAFERHAPRTEVALAARLEAAFEATVRETVAMLGADGRPAGQVSLAEIQV